MNKRIITVMSAILTLFLVIVVYLTYFMFVEAPNTNSREENPRKDARENKIMRGRIYDRNGLLLAESELVNVEIKSKDDAGEVIDTVEKQKRKYPYNNLYAHTIGYKNDGGKTGIEASFDEFLLKTRNEEFFTIRNEEGEPIYEDGADLALTLDHGMTELAANLLGEEKGSIVVINPKTGEVYCLYSNPSFDPNPDEFSKNYNELINNPDNPLYFKATRGGYAPGSTFKIITATAGIENGLGLYKVNDKGSTIVGGKSFKNTESEKSFGTIGMEDAIRVSSNVYFVNLSQEIGKEKMQQVIDSFGVTDKVKFDIPTLDGKDLGYDEMDDAKLAATSIGQGDLQVSPLQMALATCAIANDGVIMKPYMVSQAYFEDGRVIYENKPEEMSIATDKKTARKVRNYMVGCVEQEGGTGTRARVDGMEVAGKTGTAQAGTGQKEHAWFIGIAPANDPQLVICVMKDNAGRSGGVVCAPVAAEIIKYAQENGLIKN